MSKSIKFTGRGPLDECDHNECDGVCEMRHKSNKFTPGPWSVLGYNAHEFTFDVATGGTE
jgi:hypothetical protein